MVKHLATIMLILVLCATGSGGAAIRAAGPVRGLAGGEDPRVVLPEGSPPEPYTDLYVTYEPVDSRAISILVTDQVRLPDNRVRARLAVRAESLVAYNLTFRENKSDGASWTALHFYPLFPGRIYDLATVTLEPEGSFTIEAAMYGQDDTLASQMSFIQICIGMAYIVGTEIPLNARESREAVIDALGALPFGKSFKAIAGGLSAFVELIKKERDPLKILTGLGDIMEKFTELPGLVAEGLAAMFDDPGITKAAVMTGLGWLKALDVVGKLAKTVRMIVQLQEYPDTVIATVTMAPIATKALPRYRILQFDERFLTDVEFQNLGQDIWTADKGYEMLVLSWGEPIGRVRLAQGIRPGQTARWNVAQYAPAFPGIYRLTYQMAWQGVPIGAAVPGEIIVIPEGMPSLRATLAALVSEAQRKAGEWFDHYIADLERRIQEELYKAICGGPPATLLLAALVAWWGSRRRRHDDSQ